jgi:colanic acid/amylovoran biosynthesis glycosyltransferase
VSTSPLETAPPPAAGPPKLKVAYLMSRFPKLTETFILYEMIAVEEEGVSVSLYPLHRENAPVIHAEARPFVERAHFAPLVSGAILGSQLRWLRRKPGAYVRALGDLVRATWNCPNFLIGGLAVFPMVTHFAERIAAEGVDHVHAHFASHPAAAAFVIHRLTGIPYSFTAHGSDLHRRRAMLREKVREAAFVVAISDYNRRIILDECGAEYADRVVVIHCGVDPDVFQAGASAPGSGGPFRILCTGTLHEVKGQAYLIDACRRLREQGVDLLCQFVGEGPDRLDLEARIASAGLGEQVRLLGRRTRDEVAALLAEADVLVAPSVPTADGRREGIPVVLMEAMAAGVPVVASDLSGIPELVQHEQSGLLAPPRDSEALASALERLHADPDLRRRLAAAGRERVLAGFHLKRNAARLVEQLCAPPARLRERTGKTAS